MFILSVTGNVGSMRPHTTSNGNQMLVMRVGCSTSIKGDQPPYEWQDTTFWVEVVAWGDRATQWERLFKVGNAVEIVGRANFKTYEKKDGTIGSTIQIYGIEGETPAVRYATGRGGDSGERNDNESNTPTPTSQGRYRRNDTTLADDDLGI